MSGICMDMEWVVTECDKTKVAQLAGEAGIPQTIAHLLINRGLTTADDIKNFFNPNLTHLHDPSLLPDLDKGVDRIVRAIKDGEKICVHGDYDVDGVTSAALLVRTLRALKANVGYRLPHRKHDGYDIKPATVEEIAANGVKLIVTCDCGTSAIQSVERANELGVDIIITDHHEPGAVLPPAIAVINPKRRDAAYPFPELAGVGVALKVAQGIVRKLGYSVDSFTNRFVDLAALGTVADVVPLLDENRAIVKYGLQAIPATKKLGIQTMLKVTKLTDKPLTAYYLGFVLGPRINAVGRMDDATKALELFLTQDKQEARMLAEEMEHHNSDRRMEQEKIYQEAIEQIESKDLEITPILVLSSEGWNTGVVGIVAGKICEQYSRPAILLNRDEVCGMGCGSARSIPEFNLVEGLRQCGDLLDRYGGHALAAGLSISLDNLEEFEERINDIAANVLGVEEIMPRLVLDAELQPMEIDHDLADALVNMEPFGMSNPEPVFLTRNLTVLDRQRVGDGSHLRMRVTGDGGSPMTCIAFGMGELAESVQLGSVIDLCYNIRLNTFNGVESVQLIGKAIRSSYV